MADYRTPIRVEQGTPPKGQPTVGQGQAPLSHEYYDYTNFGYVDTDEFSDLTLAQELRYFDGLRKFYTFLDYNSAIGSYRQMVSDLAQTVEWKVVPAKPIDASEDEDEENPVEPTAEAKENAILVKKALRSLTVDRPWKTVVCEAMTAPVYGCAIFELSYRKQGSEWYWSDFGFRSRSSITAIMTDPKTKKLTGLRQRQRMGGDQLLNASRLMILRYQPEFGVLGRSVFQTAYSSLRRQNEMETLIINVLRGTLAKPTILRPARIGPEANKQPPDIFNSADPNATKVVKSTLDLLARCHRGERVAGIIPSWLEEALEQNGNVSGKDLLSAASRLDHSILDPVSASFLLLSQGSIGSRSLAETLVRIFLLRVNGLLQYVGDEVSRIAVPQLLRLNRRDPEQAPRIVPSEVSVVLTQPEGDRVDESNQLKKSGEADT